jgi:hypothetical protein
MAPRSSTTGVAVIRSHRRRSLSELRIPNTAVVACPVRAGDGYRQVVESDRVAVVVDQLSRPDPSSRHLP